MQGLHLIRLRHEIGGLVLIPKYNGGLSKGILHNLDKDLAGARGQHT